MPHGGGKDGPIKKLIQKFRSLRTQKRENKRTGCHPYGQRFANFGKGGPDAYSSTDSHAKEITSQVYEGFTRAYPYRVVDYSAETGQLTAINFAIWNTATNQIELNDGSDQDGLQIRIDASGDIWVTQNGNNIPVYNNTGNIQVGMMIYTESEMGRNFQRQGAQVYDGNRFGGTNVTGVIIQFYRGGF